MPNRAEKEIIRKHRGISLSVQNRVIGSSRILTDKECRELLETEATTSGQPINLPTPCWAMEREMDARVRALLGGTITDPREKKGISAELRGIAIGYSMQYGISIEDAIQSAMRRWQEDGGPSS
jgi:hypothetical protein